MEFLTDLWLPILLSAVFVFIASSILHMVVQIHRGDYAQMAGEDRVLAVMREQGVQPGDYMFPHAREMKDLATPGMIEKFKQGPVGTMTVIPSGPPAMGKNLLQWSLFSVLVSVFVAYVVSFARQPGADYLYVFRLTGTVAFLTYGGSYIPTSIWKGQKWSTTLKFLLDGLVYGLVTAGTFGWLAV